MKVVDAHGREIPEQGYLFTTNGYAYRLVRAVSPTYKTGYSVGTLLVRAVGYVQGERVEGEPREMSAQRFDVTVQR